MNLKNRSLVENSDYLKKLAKELDNSNIKELDGNLLYEVAYADTYLDVILSKSDGNGIDKDLYDVKAVFSAVLESANYDKVKHCKDYRELLSCRYDDLNNASVEKSYAVIGSEDSNALMLYFKNRFTSIVLMLVCMFFLTVGDVGSILDKVWNINVPNLEVYKSILGFIISLCLCLSICCSALVIVVDIAYITIPAVRLVFSQLENNIVSPIARECVEDCMGESVIYSKVRNFNRIERNKTWLSSMIEVLKTCDVKNGSVTEKLYTELISLQDSIKDEHGSKYYKDMSKVEFLHDKYMSLIAEGGA